MQVVVEHLVQVVHHVVDVPTVQAVQVAHHVVDVLAVQTLVRAIVAVHVQETVHHVQEHAQVVTQLAQVLAKPIV